MQTGIPCAYTLIWDNANQLCSKIHVIIYDGCFKIKASCLTMLSVTSEADVGGMGIEVEPSHQYSFTFCCHATYFMEEGDVLVKNREESGNTVILGKSGGKPQIFPRGFWKASPDKVPLYQCNQHEK